ncbi:MAG: hypothetical protein KAJ31_04155 [Deltaproteobacteria bacterium]|nr:hypothetical protein [Deltaproteobacteria bacterium]MCK5710454.1 hypothetical protein [Deltaproteobacteria bacterium]
MDGRLVELGVGLIAAIMVIREVLGFLDKKKFHNVDSLEHGAVMSEHVNDVRFAILKVKDKVDDLHDWHNKTDEDGVFNWYVRRSLEDVIKDLGVKIEMQIGVQTKILQHMQRMEEHYREKAEKGR